MLNQLLCYLWSLAITVGCTPQSKLVKSILYSGKNKLSANVSVQRRPAFNLLIEHKRIILNSLKKKKGYANSLVCI